MSITIMNREQAIRYSHEPHENKTIMISISDPYIVYKSKPRSSETNGIESVLYLEFCDADRPGLDVYGREADTSDLMSNADAAWVAALVKGHPDKDIIVHCDAGISRSAGVAAAIMLWKTGDDSPIFDSGRYYPNMWCYRKTLEALMKENKYTQKGE